ncbi:Ig-like domain-containing protein [Winogradskyella sp.]|uniref:T9SS type A sorting domain-containing protein n=1 Tax=Winogradskyella sp. TaxID=1883156 RepID=UPI002612B378|nr:Ig-like domain-containing protein [Winogradskyella sp.]
MKAPNIRTNFISNSTILYFFLSLAVTFQIGAQQLAFPTAKGAGAYSTGGRGGQVIHVTTLDWDAPGGLKEAIQTPGPRIIVFDVSGEIDATGEGGFSNVINGPTFDNITIAGQTAPPGGITILTSEFRFRNVDNVIIRYIRFRRTNSSLPGTYSQDAVWMMENNDFIIDHCAFSHGNDEAGSFATSVNTMDDITIQNCFFQDSKTGSIIGIKGEEGDFSFINNVFSNISHRFPNYKGDGRADIIGNVVYNWKQRLIRLGDIGSYDGQTNVINNYYKGAANGLHRPGWFTNYNLPIARLHQVQANNSSTGTIYSAGSYIVGQREVPQADDSDLWALFAGSSLSGYSVGDPVPSSFFTSTQFPLLGASFTVNSAADYYNDLIINGNVGAYKTLNADGSIYEYRDSYDTDHLNMIINDTYDGEFYDALADLTYPVIPENTRPANFDTNNDGMPDLWKISRGFQPDDDLSSYVWPSGYVGVEEYINEIDLNSVEFIDVTGVEVTPETATINIPDTVQLTAEILPDNATNQSGSWSSSDDSIATVSNSGTVTPISEGTVTITYTTNDGAFTDTAEITVTNIIISLESVSITPNTLTMDLGENYQLNTDFIPLNTSDTTGTWISSDETIAVVNDNGLVSSVGEGETTITFTANDGGISDSTAVTVIDTFFGTYQLYNADSDTIIQDIVGDDSINLGNESSQINFRSIPQGGDDNPDVESVEVVWTGPTSGIWVESGAIYAGLPNGHVGMDFEPYTVEAGTYNFTVTYYSANGASGDVVAVDNFALTFFFSTLPVANAGPDQDICEGDTVTLTASGGPNFLWDNGETTASIEVSPTATTTYTVSVFDNDGNFDEDSVVVTVTPIPVADVGEDQTICEGDTVTLIASGGTTYLWSTGETTESIEVSPITETTYTVEVITNNCSSIDDITVFVNPVPNITVSDDVVIVEGSSTSLGVTGSDNYLWSTGETTPFITVAPLATTTYSVSSVNPNGCSSTQEVTVTVIPEVVADAGNDVTICAGENVTLTATGGSTYLWDTGDTTAEIIVSPIVTTTYTVTVEDDYGYTDTDSVTITVNETPDITVSGDVAILEGETVTLTASGSDNYLWNTGETTASITVTPTTTTTYTVVSTAVGGCADIEQVTVTIIPEVVADAGEDVTICSGESVTLTATGGSTYLWDTGDTTAEIVVAPNVTTIYTVTVEDDYGYTDTDSVTVTVNETPDITVGDNVAILEGETVTLIASGGDNYLWNTGETTASITVTPTTTTTYTVTSSNGNCEDQEQVTVTIIPEVIANAGEDVTICNGETVILSASGGFTYFWNTGETTAEILVSPSVTTTYSVTVEDDYGYTDTDSVTVNVTQMPLLTLTDDVMIVEGGSIDLVVSGAETYLWSTGETSSSITVNPIVTTTYTVTGTNGNCSVQAQVTVTVEETFVASAGNDEYVCENYDYEVLLTATEGDSYLWNTGETTQSIVVNPLSTTTYTVTVTQGIQEDTDEVTVFVDPNPNVVILNGESVDIMNGDFVTLSASGANTYQWDNGATQPNIAVSPSQTTTYEVRGYVGDCYDEKQVTVNVIPEVIADAGEDVEICPGEVVTLSATGGDEYFWNTGQSTQSIQVSPDETTTYTVTVFNALDFDEDTVTVYVNTDCEDNEGPIDDPGDGTALDFEFSVFPNPASDIINVRLSGSTALSRVYLYDITGKLIYADRMVNDNLSISTTKQIDVSGLHPGMYYVKMTDVNRDISRKLIIR